MADAMPKDQMDFINAVEDYMKEVSYINDEERYRFAFLLWQHKEWIREFLAEDWFEEFLKKHDKPVPTGISADELFQTEE